MASAMMMMGSAYVVRITILRTLGFDATGLYQSAWTLGGLYVGFILQAMGADFYPRLTASATDNVACNRMVNEQARVGLLLAGPGAIATLTLAPLVIALFYSSRFGPAVGILRWICLGGALRVITWPMGFIILAKGKQGLFFVSELAWTIVHVGLAWTLMKAFGLNGAGMAFCGSYIFHGLLIYPLVNRLSGFRWSRDNCHTGLLFLSLIVAVFCGFGGLPLSAAACIGILAALLSAFYSLRVLATLTSPNRVPGPLRRMFLGLSQ
jgi:PST family polysaccharide transporter